MICTVPVGAMPGPVTMTVGGQLRNAYGFTALFNPLITDITPDNGLPGNLITIQGTNSATTRWARP